MVTLKNLQNRAMEVYPKVKVRGQIEDDDEINSLEALDSLSLNEFPSSVKEPEDDTPPPTVRIHQLHVSNSSVPTIPTFKGSSNKINKDAVEEDTLHIRASPIPRPRAVLSSPDNDGKIPSKNKKIVERTSALKNHSLCENRHIRCKVTTSHNSAGSPISTKRESKMAADSKTDIRGTKEPVSRNSYLRKGKPHFILS
ncbi:hypothetical protein LguiA_030496 [Lonicera macranthoides]